MNLQILKPSRKRPSLGDVFVCQMKAPADRYYFGRVIRTDAAIGGFKNTNLIYLYRTSSDDKAALPNLHFSDLLMPPLATNNLPWRHGYFETIMNSPLEATAVMPHHTFKDFRGMFFDDRGQPTMLSDGPVGEDALQSYRTIDDLLSDALGIPRAES